jgi:hypothetical protein
MTFQMNITALETAVYLETRNRICLTIPCFINYQYGDCETFWGWRSSRLT